MRLELVRCNDCINIYMKESDKHDFYKVMDYWGNTDPYTFINKIANYTVNGKYWNITFRYNRWGITLDIKYNDIEVNDYYIDYRHFAIMLNKLNCFGIPIEDRIF